jgi:ribosomal protein S27AE
MKPEPDKRAPDLQEWLVDLDLAALMASRSMNGPQVPANWKPGPFGAIRGDEKPWGTTEDAVNLLQGGNIEPGRELLRRLCKHTSDLTPIAALAFELRRPPEDNHQSLAYLKLLLDLSCEVLSIKAIGVLSALNYKLGGEFFLKADQIRPLSVHGCAMFLDAFLYASDLYFQTRLLMPRERTFTNIVVAAPLKGAAQLQLRQHEAAWQTFNRGWVFAEERAENYAKALEVKMSAEEAKFIRGTMSDMCVAGMGLVLWDLGLRREAAKIYAPLAKTLAGNCQYAARALAQTGQSRDSRDRFLPAGPHADQPRTTHAASPKDAARHCPRCGAAVMACADVRFCDQCGSPLEKEEG